MKVNIPKEWSVKMCKREQDAEAMAGSSPAHGSVVACPACRRSMRKWALDYRRETDRIRKLLCLCTAKTFRDGPCFYDQSPQMDVTDPRWPDAFTKWWFDRCEHWGIDPITAFGEMLNYEPPNDQAH